MTLALVDTSSETGITTALLQLCVEDNGIGLSSSITPGYGLQGLAERATALGGHTAIEGGEQLGGTRLLFTVPILPTNESPIHSMAGAGFAHDQ